MRAILIKTSTLKIKRLSTIWTVTKRLVLIGIGYKEIGPRELTKKLRNLLKAATSQKQGGWV